MVDVKLSQLAAQSPASVAAGAALWAGKGFIQGLGLEYVSATQLRVTSGAAHVPDAGFPVELASAVTKTLSGIGNSAWGHVYLVYAAGVAADIEIVTTAPANPYQGTARAKSGTGGTARRYLGSVKTDSTGALIQFAHDSRYVKWLLAPGLGEGIPLRVLSNGTATSPTNFSLAAAVPVTSRGAYMRLFSTNASGNLNFDIPGRGGTFGIISINPGQNVYLDMNISDTQQLAYAHAAGATAPGGYADVHGYVLER